FGVVGLETAVAVMYTHLVKKGIITLEDMVKLMAINPRVRFGIPFNNDFTLWDLEQGFKVDPSEFLSLGKATPFEGMALSGKCLLTVHNGEIVYNNL
ncbi:MAG: dihydroorotase, partial [Oscillospiraceae bacterium]|nr:dihydroorotase [Oscillospiraceae bacterium]